LWQQLRIPDHFPQVPVGILEVARVAAPEGLLRRLHDGRSRLPGLLQHGIDLFPAQHVVSEGELRRARPARRQSGVVGDARARPDRKPEAGLQVEEGDGAMLELPADDAFGVQAETVAVEMQGPLQIIHANGDDGHAGLHGESPLQGRYLAGRWGGRASAGLAAPRSASIRGATCTGDGTGLSICAPESGCQWRRANNRAEAPSLGLAGRSRSPGEDGNRGPGGGRAGLPAARTPETQIGRCWVPFPGVMNTNSQGPWTTCRCHVPRGTTHTPLLRSATTRSSFCSRRITSMLPETRYRISSP